MRGAWVSVGGPGRLAVPEPRFAWRFAALAGLALGLSQLVGAADRGRCMLALTAALGAEGGLALARPRRRAGALPWLALVSLAAAIAGGAPRAPRPAGIRA